MYTVVTEVRRPLADFAPSHGRAGENRKFSCFRREMRACQTAGSG